MKNLKYFSNIYFAVILLLLPQMIFSKDRLQKHSAQSQQNQIQSLLIGSEDNQKKIDAPSSPALISPADGDSVSAGELPLFSWLAPMPDTASGVSYKITIAEILDNQTAGDALIKNTVWFEQSGITSTSFQYPENAKDFDAGKEYGWKVQAFDGNMNPLGDNNGTSDVFMFRKGGTVIIHDTVNSELVTLVSPAEGETVAAGAQPEFSWEYDTGSVTFNLIIYEINDGQSSDDAVMNTPFFEEDGITALNFIYPSSAPALTGGKNYAWTVKVFDTKGDQVNKGNSTSWFKKGGADNPTDACISWALTTDESVTSVSGNISGENEIIGVGTSAPLMSVFLPYNNGQRLWVGTSGWIPSSPAGPDPMRYIEFNVSPQSGYTYTVTNISFDYNDNPLGTDFHILNMQAAYSTDNWSTQTVLNQSQLVYLNTSTSHFTQSVNVTVAAGQKFSLRIYPYPVIPGIAGTPTFAIHKNVEICGTATPAEVKTSSICGMKFNDLNGNGEMDINEPGLPDWTIKLSGEDTLTAVTDKTGHYCFTGLNPGTYVLSEEMQPGWAQTYPASPGTHTETLEAGGEINDINFGNMQIAPADSGACVEWSLFSSTAVTSVTGNLNAQPEIISPGSGPTPMTVYGYSNGQQLWVGNQGGTWVPNDMNNPTLDPTRYIQFDVSPDPGTVFTVTNVSFNYGDFPLNMNFNILSFIAFYSTDNWSSGTQLNSSPLIYLNTSMMLFSQSIPAVAVHSGQTFSLRIYIYPVLHGVATTPTFATHNNVEICGSTSEEEVSTGSICGMKFNDFNSNGIKDNGESGLEGWTIKAAGPDTVSAVTDATGEYCITGLQPGTYIVSEINQPGWQQTRPASPEYYTIFVAEGQNVVNVDFGNVQSKNNNCVEPPSGMAAWWPLDETSGTNSADLAGYNNAGSQINGPVSVAGKVLSGMQFDGVNDYISVPDHPELNFGTGDFSVDAWVKTSANSGIKIIVDKQTLNGFVYQGYSFYLNYGYLTVQLADGIAPNYFTNYNSAVFVADGNWHHVGITVSRNNHNGIIFYKDGVGTQYGDPTMRPGNLDNSSILTIGRQSFADQNKFNGILDEIELFNRVLSPAEMKSIFDAGSSGKCKPETPTSVTPKEEIPKTYELFRAYPNPFNPVTRIAFQIPQRSSVVLKVYDALGKEIRTLVNATKEAGYYNVDFDASDLPSGLYIYQMRTGNFSQSGKVLLIK